MKYSRNLRYNCSKEFEVRIFHRRYGGKVGDNAAAARPLRLRIFTSHSLRPRLRRPYLIYCTEMFAASTKQFYYRNIYITEYKCLGTQFWYATDYNALKVWSVRYKCIYRRTILALNAKQNCG